MGFGDEGLGDAGLGDAGKGDVAVAKSMVGTSSVFATGTPHDEQKRTLLASSMPQDTHFAMIFSATV